MKETVRLLVVFVSTVAAGLSVSAAHRLVDSLWGERAPESAQRSLDTYLSRLRSLLSGDRMRTSGVRVRCVRTRHCRAARRLALPPEIADRHGSRWIVSLAKPVLLPAETMLPRAPS